MLAWLGLLSFKETGECGLGAGSGHGWVALGWGEVASPCSEAGRFWDGSTAAYGSGGSGGGPRVGWRLTAPRLKLLGQGVPHPAGFGQGLRGLTVVWGRVHPGARLSQGEGLGGGGGGRGSVNCGALEALGRVLPPGAGELGSEAPTRGDGLGGTRVAGGRAVAGGRNFLVGLLFFAGVGVDALGVLLLRSKRRDIDTS